MLQEIGWLFASLSRQPTLPQQQQPAAAVLADGCEKSQGHSAGMLASTTRDSYCWAGLSIFDENTVLVVSLVTGLRILARIIEPVGIPS